MTLPAAMNKTRRRGGLLTDSKGWKTIDVGDELLLGAEEAGFAGLEVLEDYTLLNELGADQEGVEATEQHTENTEQQSQQIQPKKKQKKEKKKKASDVATLQAELEALRRENAALKASAGLGDTDNVGSDATKDSQQEPQQDAAPQRKQKKNKMQRDEKSSKAVADGVTQGSEGQGAQDDAATAVDISAWRMLALHPSLEKAIAQQGFTAPTEIQSAVLPLALRDRADIIGAAQTGSGKTLAFGLPIMQRILQEREAAAADGNQPPHAGKLRALIMAPTRELALQVAAHMQAIGKVASIRVVAIVGGLAHVKQERLLKAKPDVVVATPGRLWELLRDKASPHLSDMSGLTFLVLDEADKMVQKGHFQELSSILALVPRPGMQVVTYDKDFQASLQAIKEKESRNKNKEKATNGASQDSETHQDEDDDEEMLMQGGEGADEDVSGLEDDEHALASMSGDDEGEDVSEGDNDGNEDVDEQEQVMSDVDEQAGSDSEADMEDIRKQASAEAKAAPSPAADSALGKNKHKLNSAAQQQSKQDKAAVRAARAGQVQTMVFSATLTLPANLRKRLKRGGGGALGGSDLENLMDAVPFRGTPQIVDLSSSSKLAAGVSQAAINCLEGTDKDTHLYYLLLRHPGRALVFVNAVSALRRVAAILKILNLPAFALHAQQQQRQRLKALDRFKSHSNAVLVATDVAARGLDIQDVRMVVHYQLPASLDTYIHRCGRTARAGGEGVAVALVSAAEAGKWKALCRALSGGDQQQQQQQQQEGAGGGAGGDSSPVPAFPVDVTLMPAVVARIKLAAVIDDMERAHRKTAVDQSWQERAALEAGLDEQEHKSKKRYDDDDDDQLRSARLDKAKAKQLAALKQELAAMISQPLAPRMSKGFFTGGAVSGVQLSDAAARGGSSQAQEGGNAAAAVSQAVALASKITQAKQKNKTAANKKTKKVLSVEQLAKQQLMKRQAAKAARKARGAATAGGMPVNASALPRNRKGLVVIPPSQSRDLQGQDALAALKRKLAAIT